MSIDVESIVDEVLDRMRPVVRDVVASHLIGTPDLVKPTDLARELGMSVETIRAMVTTGRIDRVPYGTGWRYYVRRSQVLGHAERATRVA